MSNKGRSEPHGQDDRYREKRCICLARQSSDVDGATSVEAQLALMHKEAERLGMIVVDDIRLEGITGSMPRVRDDLEDLFRRKRDHREV